MTRIAALDDDPTMLEVVSSLVSKAGYDCATFQSGRELARCLHRETFSLFILDWQVPDLSGIEVLQRIRCGIVSTAPVILLTNKVADEDVVAGLRAGADDFVTKPFRSAVLLARIEALMRRSHQAPIRERAVFGRYVFHLARRSVSVEGADICLTQKELDLSLLLFRNINCALSRTQILETVWGKNPDISSRTLDIHVSRIRSKLRLLPERGFQISTIYGFGYRLEEIAP